MAEAHQNALLTDSEGEEADHDNNNEPAFNAQNTQFLDRPIGENGEPLDQSSMALDPNQTQNNSHIEASKLIGPTGLAQALAADDEKKGITSSVQKGEDLLENASAKEAPVCRICLMEEEEVDNPLFAPCKCAGSMRLIHHGCLKTWFANKRIMKQSPIVTTYFWKNLECELCKTPYPYETRSLDGKTMLNIIEYDTPQSEFGEEVHYIVLESISSNTSKVIHVMNFNNTTKFYIGRGHDAHVRVTDISVSRLHAVLIRSSYGFYFLTDNNSKFGTLAQVKTPLEMKPGSKTSVQIGRTVFDIEIKRNYNLALQSCLCMSGKQKNVEIEKDDLVSLEGFTFFPR